MVKHTQTIRLLLPTNCLSVFDNFVGLTFKGLNTGAILTASIKLGNLLRGHSFMTSTKNDQIFWMLEHYFAWSALTFSWRISLSYSNQSIDLHSKSMDCFLHDRELRHERVNALRAKQCSNIQERRNTFGVINILG